MTTIDAELVMQRRQTLAMISAEPSEIVINRKSVTKNTRGGLDQTGSVELPPQTVRILHAPPRRRRLENNPPDLSLIEYPYSKDYLMARWDADIQIGDQFEADGCNHKVTYVFPYKRYETIANTETLNQ